MPPSLVDETFESAAALHEAIGAEVATYELTVCADPCWVRAAAVRQRILAAGEVARPRFVCTLRWDAEGEAQGEQGTQEAQATQYVKDGRRVRVAFDPFEESMLSEGVVGDDEMASVGAAARRDEGTTQERGDGGDGRGMQDEEGVPNVDAGSSEAPLEARLPPDGVLWALLEATGCGARGVLIQAPAALVMPPIAPIDAVPASPPVAPALATSGPLKRSFVEAVDPATNSAADGTTGTAAGRLALLPPLTSEARAIKYPASLLQVC